MKKRNIYIGVGIAAVGLFIYWRRDREQKAIVAIKNKELTASVPSTATPGILPTT